MTVDRRVAIYLPSLRGGGAERSMLTLANAFAARKLAVDLVLAEATGPFLGEVGPGVELVDLNSRGVLRSLPELARYLRQVRPHCLLSAMNHANVVAILARALARIDVRVVVSERNNLSLSSRGAPGRIEKLMPYLMRHAYGRADAIVSVSHGVAEDLAAAIRIPIDRISVIYNPVVNESLVSRSLEDLDHPWFRPGAPPVILGVGRLTEQKDYPALIHAFARVRKSREARLVILGEGPDRLSLEMLARDLGVDQEVRFPGFVENPFSWMRRASVFVLSSRWEGLPGVLIQAMACGTAVVSTDCPSGPREILEGGRWGRLVGVGDIEALSKAIEETMDDSSPPDVTARARDFAVDRAVTGYLRILGIEPIEPSALDQRDVA